MSRRDPRAPRPPPAVALRIAAATAAAMMALSLGMGAARAQAPGAEIAERARAVLAGDDYQTELPGKGKITPPPGGGGLGDLPWPSGGGVGNGKDNPQNGAGKEPSAADREPANQSSNDPPRSDPAGDPKDPTGDRRGDRGERGDRGDRGDRGERSVPSLRRRSAPPPVVDPGGPSMFGVVAMSVLGAVLALLIVLGATQFLRRRTKVREQGVLEDEEPIFGGPQAARSNLADVEALAREGRFAEAVHALFQVTVSMLAQGGRLVVEDAMTGREALTRARLDDGSRASLRDLVVVVEHSLFGGGAVGPDHYERCLASYQRLASAGSAGSAASAPLGARVYDESAARSTIESSGFNGGAGS